MAALDCWWTDVPSVGFATSERRSPRSSPDDAENRIRYQDFVRGHVLMLPVGVPDACRTPSSADVGNRARVRRGPWAVQP
jgi:hypothetical protein